MTTLDEIGASLAKLHQPPPPPNARYYVNTQTKVLAPIDTQLQFLARAVIVDNLTSRWCYIPDAGRFISPFTSGKVVPLTGAQRATLQWQAPPGIIDLPTLTGQMLTAIWTDAILGPSDGSHLSFSPQQEMGVVTTPANTLTSSTFAIPTGTQAIGFIVDGINTVAFPASVTMQGVQTGTFYINQTSPGPTGVRIAPISSADTSVKCSVTGAAGGQAQVHFLSFTYFPLNALPPPYQAASSAFAIVDAGILSGGTLLLVAGVANQIIYLHGLYYAFIGNAATNGFFEDTTASILIDAWATNAGITAGPYYRDLRGVPLPSGAGFQMTNAGGANSPPFVIGGTFTQS